jgi:hypothetical protein
MWHEGVASLSWQPSCRPNSSLTADGRRDLVSLLCGPPRCQTSPVSAYESQAISGLDGRPALSPGKALKFVVEDPATNNCSSIWRIWTGKSVDDVYLCETETGGEWKTSLHNEWGRWRIAMTSEAANRDGVSRVILSEQDRVAPTADGWSEGTALLIPCSDLRPPTSPIPDKVVRAPTSPSHSAIGVRLLLQEPDSATYTKLDDGFGLGVLERPNGGGVYVVAQTTSLSRDLIASMAEIRAKARVGASEAGRYVGILASDEQGILVDLALS